MGFWPGDTAPVKLSAEELDRLSPSEQAELLALLERREAERAVDARPPIQHMLFEAYFDDADKCEDPDDYLDKLLAHERCRRKHLQEITSATPPQPPQQDGPRPPLEELIAAWGADHDEATRLATEDGFPYPTITSKQIPRTEPPASSEALSRRATLPRDVQIDIEATERRRDEHVFFNRIAPSGQDDDHLAPYRNKSSGSSWEPPSYPDW
jgi:hypothetical protein